MRLFVALEIPADVRKRLAALIGELRTLAPNLKWVRAENLHLTLKFIGEMETARLDAVRTSLGGIQQKADLELRYQGLGFFPSEKCPRVLWVGIEATLDLANFASEIDAALTSCGFPRDQRTFAPHLTLARLDGRPLPAPFRDAISAYAGQEFGATRATQFHLIESKLKSTGAEYTTVQSFSLAPES